MLNIQHGMLWLTHLMSLHLVSYPGQVNELQRRQRKEHEKEVKRREKLQEKEKAERAAQAKLRMEEEAYQLQVGLGHNGCQSWQSATLHEPSEHHACTAPVTELQMHHSAIKAVSVSAAGI